MAIVFYLFSSSSKYLFHLTLICKNHPFPLLCLTHYFSWLIILSEWCIFLRIIFQFKLNVPYIPGTILETLVFSFHIIVLLLSSGLHISLMWPLQHLHSCDISFVNCFSPFIVKPIITYLHILVT